MSSKKTKNAKKPSTKKTATASSDGPVEFFPKKSTGGKKPKATTPVITAKPAKAAKESKTKKLSALDAAAQVLAKAKVPMNAKALIEAMAEQKLWTTPGGKTPHATLYAAMLREINEKGKDARFKKADRGLFTHA